jgi:hypothetical protein
LPVHREPPLNRSMNTSLQGASQVHVVYTSTCPA